MNAMVVNIAYQSASLRALELPWKCLKGYIQTRINYKINMLSVVTQKAEWWQLIFLNSVNLPNHDLKADIFCIRVPSGLNSISHNKHENARNTEERGQTTAERGNPK